MASCPRRPARVVFRHPERRIHSHDRGRVDLAVLIPVRRLQLGVPEHVAHRHERQRAGEDGAGGVAEAVELDGAEAGGCGGALGAAADG